ncbi:hypothetical protein DPMN_087749 [Dreissena polymorpha]|uniref:Uncharacterized protein n=1 Tax=Dreissena polymorpha TaxID=45954 RepID=A0A9D4KSW7_DREPO|nr:hypothetical protein DPMN_087749 [Dreissena polymorpha]
MAEGGVNIAVSKTESAPEDSLYSRHSKASMKPYTFPDTVACTVVSLNVYPI